MKNFYFLFLIFLIYGCNPNKIFHNIPNDNIYSSIKRKADSFEHNLATKIIDPDYIVNASKDTILFDNFVIVSLFKKDQLSIVVNKDTIKPYKYETLNKVWAVKDSVNYANTIRQIKYYQDHNLLMFQLYFYPCTGLGCGVNYQLIYSLSNKKVFAFGRFRTGDDMNLYHFDNQSPFYLSKSFNGRNIENRDTITYELFKIEKDKTFNLFDSTAKNKAIFIYDNDTLIDFKVDWLEN